MKNGLEIERRWLLGMLPDPNKAVSTTTIVQLYGKGYPHDDGTPFRIRLMSSHDEGKSKYFLTRKKKLSEITSHEIENEISLAEFDNRLFFGSCSNEIKKVRFVFEHEGLAFEVDLYKTLRLIVMEVELESEDQEFDIPDFIQSCIITEISGNLAFSNYNLSKIKK